MHGFIASALMAVLCCTRVTAQLKIAGTDQIHTQKLTAEDGLSESIVNTIIKDADGFIWAGTDRGLNRFDGYQFRVFNHTFTDSTSLGNDKVNVLFTDSKKRLWVGTTNGGLNLFERKTETFKRFLNDPRNANSLSQNTVLSITEDASGKMWIGTYEGLNVFDPATETFTRMYAYAGTKSLTGNIIYSLARDYAGNMWVGTENGISVVHPDGGITNHSASESGAPLFKVLTMCHTADNDVWIGTEGNGLIRFNGNENRFVRYNLDFGNSPANGDVIRKIIQDRDGNLLLGTDGAGVIILNPKNGKFKRISSRNDPTLLNAGVYDLYLDNENILWIGTYGGGIKIRNNQKYFMHHDTFDSAALNFGKNSVLAITEDKNHHIWIGTDGAGLHRFDPVTKKISSYVHVPGKTNTISSNVIKSLLVDRHGNIYAGTYNGGLNYIDLKSNTITTYRHNPQDPHSISSDHVWCLFEDSDGRIWAGSPSTGVDEFLPDKNIFIRYHYDPKNPASLSSDVIFTIFEDSHRNLWFGTRDDGLSKLNKTDNTFIRYTIAHGLSSNEIREITQDSKGRLWIATTNGGLNYYDSASSRFQPFRKQGYRQEDVLSVLEDNQGNLWLGTFNGLIRLNPATGKMRHYDAGDGLRGNEFNYGARLKSSRNEFYFGGLNGLISFTPEDIHESTTIPPIVLTSLKLFHREVGVRDGTSVLQAPITYQEEITLEPGQDVITIGYAALSYQLPRKSTYQYMLEGFDSGWNYAGSEHAATYTNLPPGNYVFRVIGANNDGLWNEHGATLKINVLPPWYQIRWIQVLLAGVLVGGIALLIHVRTRILLHQKIRLEKLVHDRTTQIELQKREIELQNGELELQNEELRARNEEIIAQREEIEEKSLMLERAHEEIQTVNDQLLKVNGNLEKLVEVRTAELKQAMQKLIETDEGLNLFLYRSSHDLRGPITTLQGLAGLARKENNQKEIEHYFDKILMSCEHMLRVLKKLNETNQIFRTNIETVHVNWNDIIHETLKEIKKLNPSGTVNIHVENNIHQSIQSDPFLIRNIIHNLMENAVTFNTSSNHNPYAKLSLEACDSRVVIKVRDNGIGISEEIRDKIFEMFYRGSDRSVGNGLGLYLVKKSADMLGGKIEITSQTGQFTEVTVTFPITVGTVREN